MGTIKYLTHEEFRKLQLTQIPLIEEVDRVCRKHNIKYTIACGTLLGAVRHKGYIPWDDDADITMLREDYEAVGMDFRPVMLVSPNNCEDVADKSSVSAVHSMKDLIAAFDKMMEIMNLLVYFMVVFSVLLIVIVLYNSGNLSFNEREKEFATLKVLGFKSNAVRRLLSTQNLWLSVIGCIFGLPLGRVPLQAMMDSNGDAVDWPCYIAPTTYIIAAIFVMTVSVLVSFMFSRRIKKIDMVEVLKGME